MTDPEVIRARYESSFREMILRDRNHPCIAVWGMLNEQFNGRLFRMAVETLKLVRSLDATRLVVLSSGRWDADLSVGSVSNPGSVAWECVWGAEGDPKAKYPAFSDHNGPVYAGQGDFHPYPKLPVRDEDKTFLRTVGDTLKPVFISEGGFGVMDDFIGQLRRYEQAGVRADHERVAQLRPLPEKLNADLRRFGMEALYPFPRDIMRASQRLNLRQRRLWFDLLRSNPNICGHSLTSMFGGSEGFCDPWREMNPGIGDVLRDGWAPLRWCLFAEPIHGYVGRPIRLEAVLANEDVLQPGSYPVTFRVWGETGIVWEKRIEARLPASGKGGLPPLAVPVLSENVCLDLPPGEYTFGASLETGGAPAGDRMTFWLSDPAALPRVNQPVTVWGIPERVCDWLVRQGVRPRTLTGSQAAPHDVILVGRPSKTAVCEWPEVLRRIDAGAVAIFMEPEAFDPAVWAPCPLRISNDWLQHKEYVAKSHAVMNGLQTSGMLDPDYYGPLFAPRIFDREPPAQEVIVAAFACGVTYLDPLYAAGVVIGRYARGSGQYILNALAVLDNVDRHPAADRLLLNLIDMPKLLREHGSPLGRHQRRKKS